MRRFDGLKNAYKMVTCYIGIGSNLGDRENNIKKALTLLHGCLNTEVEKASAFYETQPQGCPGNAGRFLNAAAKIKTAFSPRELLRQLQSIEKQLGRIRPGKRNSSRSIDLDILFYNNQKISLPSLKIPHPRLRQRAFVLKPLKEIAPETIRSLAKETKIISTLSGMRGFIAKEKAQNMTIGFVPTMGFLHEGHLSLIRQAKKDCDTCVVSIFVNPIQFGPQEDYKKYPRDLEQDSILAKSAGASCVFYPNAKDMYPPDYLTYVNVEKITDYLCGASRPGHFKGVATVVTKLFNIIQPHIAYFGQKDYQQALVIRKMVEDLNMPITIKTMPIVRECDGLAMSSRNAYLTTQERADAVVLYQSLQKAREMVRQGQHDARIIKTAIKTAILKKKTAKIEYISVADARTLEDREVFRQKTLIALAVWIGRTRLIDNIIIEV